MTDPLTADAVESLLQGRWPETRIEPSLVRMQALMDLMESVSARRGVRFHLDPAQPAAPARSRRARR